MYWHSHTNIHTIFLAFMMSYSCYFKKAKLGSQQMTNANPQTTPWFLLNFLLEEMELLVNLSVPLLPTFRYQWTSFICFPFMLIRQDSIKSFSCDSTSFQGFRYQRSRLYFPINWSHAREFFSAMNQSRCFHHHHHHRPYYPNHMHRCSYLFFINCFCLTFFGRVIQQWIYLKQKELEHFSYNTLDMTPVLIMDRLILHFELFWEFAMSYF